MCLAIPGKVVEIFDEAGLVMGNVDYGGALSRVCLEYVPEIQIGQYTVVHAGFALSIIDEAEARKSLDTWKEMEEGVAEKYGTDIFGKPI
jgi:hydrogenase expression/formation protein HypC